MDISQILSPDTTLVCNTTTSKKKVLERISQLVACSSHCDSQRIYESLLGREKLGTTALGDGIAIPHGRCANIDTPSAVMILLEQPIDYDAPDKKPVDIVFSIIVPKDADKTHLSYLATIAKSLSDPLIAKKIRNAHSSDSLYQIVIDSTQEKDERS